MDNKFLKLTNSVYKLLEFFPESDPLKNRAKDKALAILENPNPEDIDILLGYLWIAKTQGWLNSVNYLIVANEYEKLRVQTTSKPTVPDWQGPPSHKVTARQGKILEFLSKKEKAQVMDLQTVLPDITKRTIRRDLDELLGAGKITRLGEFNQVFYQISQTPRSGVPLRGIGQKLG
jgi:DNA-binding transcriptional ArsR family regulator